MKVKAVEKLAAVTRDEFAELDRMVAEAQRMKSGTVTMAKILRDVSIDPVLGSIRVYFFVWAVGEDIKGVIGHRLYGDDQEIAAFEVTCARYLANALKVSKVTITSSETAK